mgnify:CR=1 FL=1
MNLEQKLKDLEPALMAAARTIAKASAENDTDDLFQVMVLAILTKNDEDPEFLNQTDWYVCRFASFAARHAVRKERNYLKYVEPEGSLFPSSCGRRPGKLFNGRLCTRKHTNPRNPNNTSRSLGRDRSDRYEFAGRKQDGNKNAYFRVFSNRNSQNSWKIKSGYIPPRFKSREGSGRIRLARLFS